MKICNKCGCVVEESCSTCNESVHAPDIIECAQHGLLDEMKQLIEMDKADVNQTDSIGATPLHWAAINNFIEMVRYLTTFKQIQLNVRAGDLNSTPLYWAVRRNRIYVVAELLQHDANPDIPDNNGVNSLFLSVQCEYVALTAFLIASNCSIDTRKQDDLNMTPLMWNCRYQNNLSILWTLLNLRASVNLQDDDGNTALHYAAMQNRLSAVRSLLSFGADYRGQNTNGMTPLACAKACNYSRLVQLLEAYQELEERKEHRVFRWCQENSFRILFFLPFIFILLVMILIPMHFPNHAASAIGLVTLASTAVIQSTGLCLYADNNGITPLMFGLNIASCFWLMLGNLVYVTPYVELVHFVIQWISAAMLCLCLYWTTTTDPGCIRKGFNEKIEGIRQLVFDPPSTEVGICPTCLIRQPLRSKHNNVLGCCIAKFDHYCPFVNNAIGAENHHYFIGFLFFAELAILTDILGTYLYFKAHHAIQDSFFSTIMYLFHHHTSMTCLIGIGVCHVWWIGGLLVLQSYLMLRNLTTNEMLTNRKLRFGPFQSIYSRGLLLNVLEMFHLSIGPWHALDIDWKTVLDFSDYSFAKNMDRPNEESQSFIL